MKQPPNIVNTADLPWEKDDIKGRGGDRFAYRRKAVSKPAGGEKLGCSLYRVPPGKRAFPAHKHHGNEEAIYILAGEGSLRRGEARHQVAVGDYIALPAGGPEHQLENTGATDLEYLCLSTMIHPEVVEYPDSGKFGILTGSAPGGDRAKRTLYAFYKLEGAVDYYEDE